MAPVLAPEPPLSVWLAALDAQIARAPHFFDAGPVLPDPGLLVPETPDAAGMIEGLVARAVRSGQWIVHEAGDVTILGTVVRGAKIVAGGSIHVHGALRGRAIAGLAGKARPHLLPPSASKTAGARRRDHAGRGKRGATLAMSRADMAVLVTNAGMSSVRDPARIIGLLDSKTARAENRLRMSKKLLLTRYDAADAARREMPKIEDVLETPSIPLLGIIPESQDVLPAFGGADRPLRWTARVAPAGGGDRRTRHDA